MGDLAKEILENADISIEGMSEEGLKNIQVKVNEISKEWERLGITSDFIFCKVMQDRELLEELVHMILPEIEFDSLEVTAQKAIEIGRDIHGVRFDIYAKSDDGTVIQIEMQVLNQGNLPRRLRYYGSMSDSDMLDKGVIYSKLKDSFTIAICPFDFYKEGLHRYTFTNRCHEIDGLEMGDGTTKIVLNAVGTADDVHGKLKEFLNYVAGKPSDDEYVKKVDAAVYKARQNREWRREYMTLIMRDLENQEIGIEQGRNLRDREKIEAMLKRGKTVEEIVDFCDYPIKLVEEVQESLLVTQ